MGDRKRTKTGAGKSTTSNSHKYVFIALILFIAFVVIRLGLDVKKETSPRENRSTSGVDAVEVVKAKEFEKHGQPKLPTGKLWIGKTEITVEIASTVEERTKGLSHRPSMGEMEGMLFIFETEEVREFWMYQMNFPLDFLWIQNGKVVHITENVPPPRALDMEPARVNSLRRADMVLEVNAGFVQRHGITVGQKIKLEKP